MILTGKLAKLLNRRDIYLSIIDGFEMEGMFDLYLDIDNKLVTYGRNLTQESKSNEIIVIKSDVVPSASRVVIPDVPNRARAKVVFSGELMSQGFEQRDMYAFNPSIEVITIPDPIEKVVIDGELRNGCVLSHYTSNQISFVSSYGGIKYDSLVIDCRMKPAIYGPKASDNKIKLQNWRDGSKE